MFMNPHTNLKLILVDDTRDVDTLQFRTIYCAYFLTHREHVSTRSEGLQQLPCLQVIDPKRVLISCPRTTPCAMFTEEIGELGLLLGECHVERGFTRLVLSVHVCAALQ